MSWPNVFDEPLRSGGVHQVSRVYFAAFKNDRPDVDGMYFIAAFKKIGRCLPSDEASRASEKQSLRH
jgi:hypothetical protein